MRTWLAGLTLVATIVASGVVGIPSGAGGQEMETEAEGTAKVAVRIVARRLADGRTEFGLRQQLPDGRWAAAQLPRLRFVPPEAAVGRWLTSSPVSVSVALDSPIDRSAVIDMRIAARRIDDGRIEFALQQRLVEDTWSRRLLPARRFFPVGAVAGRWLASTSLIVTTARSGATEFGIGGGARSGDTLVASNFDRTCAVTLGGGVTCWGRNGLRERFSTATIGNVVTVSVGPFVNNESHTCALHDDGTVSCWGPGSDGQLGQNVAGRVYAPVRVPGITDATALAAGGTHTCAVHADGDVSCWGDGDSGQLGDGSRRSTSAPQRVPGLRDVVTITAGQTSVCAVHLDGTVSCWGWVPGGSSLSPRKVPGLRGAISVAIGFGDACAVTAVGNVHCWGNNSFPRPGRVSNLEDVAAVSVGERNFCALHNDGGVSCWGRNTSGELGDGTTVTRSQPRRLTGISDAVAITTSIEVEQGRSHACAMHRDGSVSCWGNNRVGQLGDGTRETRLLPTRVVEFGDIHVDRVPAEPTEFLRTWMDAVVAKHRGRFPWLQAAWGHAREISAVAVLGVGGSVHHFCELAPDPVKCTVSGYQVQTIDLGIAVHELAHVYDLHTGLAPRKAWGAVQLYFAVKMSECKDVGGNLDIDVELLADAMLYLVAPHHHLLYYSSFDCPGSTGVPSREAQQVLRSGLAGEVPDWYTENITNGSELWAALRKDLSLRMLFNLQDEFGGLCSKSWIHDWHVGGDSEMPAAGTNPFRDGGC